MRGSGKRCDDHDHCVEHQKPPAAAARPHVQTVRMMVMATVPVHPAMVMLMDVWDRHGHWFRSPAIAEPLPCVGPPSVFGWRVHRCCSRRGLVTFAVFEKSSPNRMVTVRGTVSCRVNVCVHVSGRSRFCPIDGPVNVSWLLIVVTSQTIRSFPISNANVVPIDRWRYYYYWCDWCPIVSFTGTLVIVTIAIIADKWPGAISSATVVVTFSCHLCRLIILDASFIDHCGLQRYCDQRHSWQLWRFRGLRLLFFKLHKCICARNKQNKNV